eukprot:6492760-Amphidinium_carterae.8
MLPHTLQVLLVLSASKQAFPCGVLCAMLGKKLSLIPENLQCAMCGKKLSQIGVTIERYSLQFAIPELDTKRFSCKCRVPEDFTCPHRCKVASPDKSSC